MGLLTIIRKNREKEKEMKILFLGLDNAGKTTILKKLNGEDIKSISPTLGFNIKTFVHGKKQDVMLIGDVGGQRTLRPYWRNYFEQTDALVWVVDSSDRMRMADCKDELHSLLTEDVRLTYLTATRSFLYLAALISCGSDSQAHLSLFSPTNKILKAPLVQRKFSRYGPCNFATALML
ncbi:ADP-ribosylation factor-like protein 2 [Termitomyces sp. T32_za158]|nr:ADP-ribosylation factor-like protein 2 [Termitomyces sp. T32_za158]